MKTVLLLRHAKSSWDEPHLSDLLRPLAPRGRKAAPRLGAFMAGNDLIPDLVLCSPARRTMETWDLVSQQLDTSIQVEVQDDLYHASPGSLLAALHDLPDSVDTVMLVGHNPTMEDLAMRLVGSGSEEIIDEMARKYPTGALAVFGFPVERWTEIREGTGHLRSFILPRNLP